MLLRLVAFTLSTAIFQGSVPAAPYTGKPYLCNFSKVKNLRPESYLNVRSGAGVRFRKIDRLRNGMEVYICNERGDWYQVFYGGPCGPTSSKGLDVQKTTECKSGWVNSNWIDVISG